MSDSDQDFPLTKTIQMLLDRIEPGTIFAAASHLPGSYSNFTYLVEAHDKKGATLRFVFRRYAVFGHYDQTLKAIREFKTYELIRQYGLSAPQPLYLDKSGEFLGAPGIVTTFMPGNQMMFPVEPIPWAQTMARTLAQIHAISGLATTPDFLLDAGQEAAWFIRYATPPTFMETHPLGKVVWQTVHKRFSSLLPTPPTLVHMDYWPGNILWQEKQISAVVDWEEASWGDPAIDVAYCRMNMLIDGLDEAAHEFLRTYESASGRAVANLAYWELAAAARPMTDLEGWQLTEPPRRDRLTRFIRNALGQLDDEDYHH